MSGILDFRSWILDRYERIAFAPAGHTLQTIAQKVL